MHSRSTDRRFIGCAAGNGMDGCFLQFPLRESSVGHSLSAEPTQSKGSPPNTVHPRFTHNFSHSTAWANQSMEPTQHFVVSFRSMRTPIVKVLGGYLFLVRRRKTA